MAPELPSPAALPAIGVPEGAMQLVLDRLADTEARDIVIETDALHAVFTNRGAALKSWRLNRYKDRAGKPVDLVPQTLPDSAKPFQLQTRNSALDARATAPALKRLRHW